MTDITPIASPEVALRALAKRYRGANSVGLQVLNMLGGQAENLLERLPDGVKLRLESVAERALTLSLGAAARSRAVVPDQQSWLNKAMTTALGAAGGSGGLPSALAEAPITVTVLMRAMLGIAAEYGFDPESDEVAHECLMIFAAAGPLADDDGADIGFLAARATLTGAGVGALIARVAPRVATVLGQKLASQTVPVLGAVSGAAVNYAYTSYYQEMAHVRFHLLRLERDTGWSRAQLQEGLRAELDRLKLGRT